MEDFEKTDLFHLKELLVDDDYIVLCHGTTLSMDEIKDKIMNNGLYATGHNEGSSLLKTTNPVDVANYNIDELKDKLNNWPHESNNIVFVKLPLKFFNAYSSHDDLDCQRTRAFQTKVSMKDGRYKYLLDPKFVVGAYNLDDETVVLNPNYEKEMSKETEQILQQKLTAVQEELGVIDIATNQAENKMNNEEEQKDYKYYYNEMIKCVKKRHTIQNPTEEEKKQIIGEIFYNQMYLLEKLNTEDEFREIMTLAVNDLFGDQKDNELLNIVLEEMKEKLQKEKNKSNNDNEISLNDLQNNNTSKLDFSIMINQLKDRTKNLGIIYKKMLSDKVIDDIELDVLIRKVNELGNYADTLKGLVNNGKEKIMLESIIQMINDEKNNMNRVAKGIEDINHSFGR